MKFSTQEEYGLRCLIRIGKFYFAEKSLTIPELSQMEDISEHTVAKLLRVLRIGGILTSERGQMGGYTLSHPPDEINLGDVLDVLGGKLFDSNFCDAHSGAADVCTNTSDCSVRSLWSMIQSSVDNLLNNFTLQDLLGKEIEFFERAAEVSSN